MGFDLMKWCNDNQGIVVFILILVLLQCTGYLKKIMNSCGMEGFDIGDFTGQAAPRQIQVAASEPLGQNEAQQAVTGLGRTPSSCYPQQKLTPEDLLPSDENAAIKEFNIAKPIGEGILQGVNMLDASYHVGVNTVGQSLRNANLQLRSDPPNPQVNVSPWMNTTISPDLPRRPLEVGESCPSA